MLLALLAAALAATSPQSSPRRIVATGQGSVSAELPGPLSLRIRAEAASVSITAAAGPAITVGVEPALPLKLIVLGGGRVELEYDGKAQLQSGKLTVAVPRGTRVDATSVAGAISVSGLASDVRARTMSGRIDVLSAARVDAETVDGGVTIRGSPGPLRIHTISGASRVEAAGGATELQLESASGPLDFIGPCAQGCHIDADTVSGQIRLALDKASSFELTFASHKGKLRDDLKLLPRNAKRQASQDVWREGTYGDAAGAIECETFSADVIVTAR